jgi:hypothetical protein
MAVFCGCICLCGGLLFVSLTCASISDCLDGIAFFDAAYNGLDLARLFVSAAFPEAEIATHLRCRAELPGE